MHMVANELYDGNVEINTIEMCEVSHSVYFISRA
jgi:hypothetical protein